MFRGSTRRASWPVSVIGFLQSGYGDAQKDYQVAGVLSSLFFRIRRTSFCFHSFLKEALREETVGDATCVGRCRKQ